MTRRLAAAVLDGGGLLIAAPLWLWWAVDRGGYPSPLWIGGLVVLALAMAVALVAGPPAPLRGARAVAVCALAALAAISALSILVASDRGLAWLWSERALLYALAFALPVLWPPSLRALRTGLVLWVAAALAALAVGVAQARHGVLVDGRLTDPTAYPNATAALLLMGAAPAAMLACVPGCGLVARVLGLAAAGTLAAGALLTQSRGILIVAAVVAAGAILVHPSRLRLAAGGACVLAAVAWQRHALLDLRHLAAVGAPAEGVTGAVAGILAIASVLAVAGLAWWLVEQRFSLPAPSPLVRRGLRRACSAAAVAATIAVALTVSNGRPTAWASERLQDFKTPDYQSVESGSSRFGAGLGSNRFDYWRVALNSGARHPLLGSGAGSFAETYFAERRTRRAPAYAHQLWLGTAAELGLLGLAALLVFAVALARAALRRCRALDGAEAGLLLAALAPLAVLLVHSSGDWTFAFPGLAVPALGLAGGAIAARPGERGERGDRGAGAGRLRTRGPRRDCGAGAGRLRARGPRRAGRVRIAAAALVLVLAAIAVPLAVGEQFVQRAGARAATDPAAARADLRSATSWAPWSARPALALALLELRAHRNGAAQRAFAMAHERDPGAWFVLLELAVLAPASQRERARALARRAAAANPGDPLIAAVRRDLARGRPVSALAVAHRALDTPG